MISTYYGILEGIFEKKFDLKVDGVLADHGDSLPPPSQQEFNELYFELASLKSTFESQEWYNHTTFTHPMKNLSRELKKQFGISYATQAYCKLTEIFSENTELKVNSFKGDVLRSLHLCEAPGAFIYATQDALRGTRLDWTATSLNPHYEWNDANEMFTEDDVICRHPERWNFGKSNSGDVLEASASDFEGKTFDLVTADGSLHCEGMSKEYAAYSILEAEVRVALEVLRPGGDFLMKMYSLSSRRMRLLVERCVNSFKTVRLCKPSASKPSAFEVYLVCCGFIPEPTTHHEMDCILYKAAAFFVRTQEEVCRFNAHSFREWSRGLKNAILDANRNAMDGWISSFTSFDSSQPKDVECPQIPWHGRRFPHFSAGFTESIDFDWTWSVEEDLTCGSRCPGPVFNSLFVPRDWNNPNNNGEDFALSSFSDANACVDRFLDGFFQMDAEIRLNIGEKFILSRLSASVIGALCFCHTSVCVERGEFVFVGPVEAKREALERFLLTVKSHRTKCGHEDILAFIGIRKMADERLYRLIVGFNALQRNP